MFRIEVRNINQEWFSVDLKTDEVSGSDELYEKAIEHPVIQRQLSGFSSI